MFQSSLRYLVLALAALPAICNAKPIPDDSAIAAHAPFGCDYAVKPNTSFINNNLFPTALRQAPTLARCVKHCDTLAQCAFAQFKPQINRDDNNCELSLQLGFAREPSKPSATKTFIQLKPNSCDKPVAKPTPLVCKPHVFTRKDGCKFNVTCNAVSKPPRDYQLSQTKTPDECATQLNFGSHNSIMNWFQGGACHVYSTGHFVHPNLIARKNTLTYQIIKNSCTKAIAQPPSGGGGGGGGT